jgi:hypothetical protein
MIDSFISAVAIVLGWIIGVIADIAYFFGRVASYAADIPGVGGYLQAFFTSIQAAFNDFGYDFVRFSTRVQDVLNAIDNWLDDLADLINDVSGWIMDRLDDAYYRARDALDWIADAGMDLYRDVYGRITELLNDAYYAAQDALNWVAYTGMDLYRDVYGWITETLSDASNLASDAWDWIVANAAKLEDIPALIRDELLQIVGPVFNLVEFFFDDINLFFTDPPAYFQKKLTDIGETFAQGFWDFIEAILERIW